MSKSTIFGEEHFIDTTMINLVKQKNDAIDNYIFERMENEIKGTMFVEMPQVIIDKEKLKKWVTLCMKLENIEHSDLIDMATKKKITDLEAKLAESEKLKDDAMYNYAWLNQDLSDTKEQLKIEKDVYKILSDNYNTLSSAYVQLKQQLAEKETAVISKMENGETSQNQTAIAELEKVKVFIIKNNEPTKKMTAITRFINQQIKELKGEK